MSLRTAVGAVVGGLLLSLVGVVPAPAQQAPRPVWTPPQVVARDVYPTDLAMNARGAAVISWSCDEAVCLRRRSPVGELTRVVRVPVDGQRSPATAVALDARGTAIVATSVLQSSYANGRYGPLLIRRVSAGGTVGEPVVVEESASPSDLVVSPTGDVAVHAAQSGDDTWLRVLTADGTIGPAVPTTRSTLVEAAADGFHLLDVDASGTVRLRIVRDGAVVADAPVGATDLAPDLVPDMAVRDDGSVVVAWWEGPRSERRLRARSVSPSGELSPTRALTGKTEGGRQLELTALPDGRVLAAFRSRAGVRGGVVPARLGPWMRLGPALLQGYDQHLVAAHDRVVLVGIVDTWMDHHVAARTWDGRRVSSKPKRIIEAPGYDNDCGSSEIEVASAGGHVLVANRRSHSCGSAYDKLVVTYRR